MAALILCAGCTAASTAAASCVGPYLDDRPPSAEARGPAPTVVVGTTLTVYGHWYTDSCNDAGQGDPVRPLAPVHLTLTMPGGQVEQLGRFTPAGRDLGFSTVVAIPLGTPSGTATVRDDRRPGATFTVEAPR